MGIMPDWVWQNIITTSPAFLLFKIRCCLVQRVHTPQTRSHLSNEWHMHYDIHLSFIAPWTPSASSRGTITHIKPKTKVNASSFMCPLCPARPVLCLQPPKIPLYWQSYESLHLHDFALFSGMHNRLRDELRGTNILVQLQKYNEARLYESL